MNKTTATSTRKNIPDDLKTQLRDLLLPSFREHRLRLFFGLASLLLVDLLQLTVPRLIKHGVDALENMTVTTGGLFRLGLMIMGIAAVVVALRFAWRYLIIGFSRFLEQAIRNRIFSHILKMDAVFFEHRTTGDLMAHSSNDLASVQMACGMGLVAAVDSVVMCVAAIGFMIAIHPLLTLLALLPMPLLAVATRILSGKLHRRFSKVQELFSELTEFSRSNLISIGLIKAYTMENFQTGRFDRLGRQYLQSNLKVAAIQGLISPIATLFGSMGMLMVLYFGGSLVIKESITLGDFVAFITYLYMLIWPMMAIGWVANLVQRGLTSLGRIYDLVTSRPVLPDPVPEPKAELSSLSAQTKLMPLRYNPLPPLVRPGFVLKNLHFTYPSSSSPALRHMNLTLGPGIHGVTGRTGSGKTTLCRLLARIYPVEGNMLFFGDHDVNSLPLAFLRSHIGYVSQEPVLFSDTIAANIALGNSEASREEIVRAAEAAAIHADIAGLPKGYDTVIGERGVKLSGGQRQRLALARALLCDRPVLIIDDGLSAVDVATEHEVFAGLKHHFLGKTVIIVSNRIKLLSMTDHIIVLADGAIASEGDHEKLLAVSPLYQAMYAKQMKQDSESEVFVSP